MEKCWYIIYIGKYWVGWSHTVPKYLAAPCMISSCKGDSSTINENGERAITHGLNVHRIHPQAAN